MPEVQSQLNLTALNIPVDTSNEIVVEDEDGNQEAKKRGSGRSSTDSC
jgi:hypothetical protein